MNKTHPKAIVFITGAFVSHSCWDEWVTFFNSRGYTAIVPPWPGKNADAETLRSRHPDKTVASVTLEQIVDHYAGIVKSLPEKPILIGHSFGGSVSQILMDRGLAAGVVSIHGAPPKGVFPYEINFLRSTSQALGLFTSLDDTYMMSFSKWQFAFTNGMTLEQQKNAYYAYAIPESKRAARGGLTDAAKVDFRKPHVPILFLAGSEDQIITAHLCKRVYQRYSDKNSLTEFVLNRRNHFILGLPTWKADAEFIIDWLRKHV